MNRKKPAKIICRGCENSFLTINNRLKYCSDDCKKVVHRKKYGKKPIKFGKCIFCRKGANTIINKKPLCKTCFYREKFKIIKGKNRSATLRRLERNKTTQKFTNLLNGDGGDLRV